MKLTAIIIICMIVSTNVFSQLQLTKISTLYHLEGTWMMQGKTSVLYEIWEKTPKGDLQSKSFRVKGNDTIPMETVLLTEDASGVYYRPTVADQNNGKEVSFLLTKVENQSYHFINKLHDFPKRIIYTFKSNNHLEVVIDDNVDMSNKQITFSFIRQK